MTLSAQDRVEITDLINLHGQLVDAGDLDQADQLFTPDVTYDLSDFGLGLVHGLAELRDAAVARGSNQPVGHHVTNIVITPIDDHSAQVRSKGIGIMADGSSGSVSYDDLLVRRPTGWKISRRKASAQRSTPVDDQQTGPLEVFERYRQATLDHSPSAIGELFGEAATLEFPFTRPGLPSRLEGRAAIVEWIGHSWGSLTYDAYETIAIHTTGDPETIIVEQAAIGTRAGTGDFRLPNIVVFTARAGKIIRLRDYVNVLAALDAIGADT
ncbi:MAG: nuclear transport factor 2 family protein [Microlunatus sp.]|nr:nuclear transport factor 2 family protein [Microlunatus sp.]